jgi:D-citramalate synthase
VIKKKPLPKKSLPYIISDVLDSQTYQEKLLLSPIFYLTQRHASIDYFIFKIDGEIIEEHAQGDGQFDAL